MCTKAAHSVVEENGLNPEGLHDLSMGNGKDRRGVSLGEPLIVGSAPAGTTSKLEVGVDVVDGHHHGRRFSLVVP